MRRASSGHGLLPAARFLTDPTRDVGGMAIVTTQAARAWSRGRLKGATGGPTAQAAAQTRGCRGSPGGAEQAPTAGGGRIARRALELSAHWPDHDPAASASREMAAGRRDRAWLGGPGAAGRGGSRQRPRPRASCTTLLVDGVGRFGRFVDQEKPSANRPQLRLHPFGIGGRQSGFHPERCAWVGCDLPRATPSSPPQRSGSLQRAGVGHSIHPQRAVGPAGTTARQAMRGHRARAGPAAPPSNTIGPAGEVSRRFLPRGLSPEPCKKLGASVPNASMRQTARQKALLGSTLGAAQASAPYRRSNPGQGQSASILRLPTSSRATPANATICPGPGQCALTAARQAGVLTQQAAGTSSGAIGLSARPSAPPTSSGGAASGARPVRSWAWKAARWRDRVVFTRRGHAQEGKRHGQRDALWWPRSKRRRPQDADGCAAALQPVGR